jgi:S-formylglutathione hydrolase FrmB
VPRKLWIVPVAVLALAVAPAGAANASGAGGLRLVATQHLNPRLLELTFRTNALTTDTHVRILLPPHYRPAGHTRYPVLYLLHGSIDDYRSWTDKGDAERVSANRKLFIVMPDAGSVGNYVDWFNDGAFGPPEWETYHIRQLLPWIDHHFPTIARRSGRALAGLSMGGGGTMKYAAAYPDLFVAALAFSGAVDLNNSELIPVTTAGGLSDGSHSPGAIYGTRPTEEVRWRNNNPWDLAANLGGLRLWFLTGNGDAGGPNGNSFDGVEADVHQQAVAVHEHLLALGIPHVWDDYGPGGHQWYYWHRDLVQTLPALMRVFAHPPAAPSQFTYTRADPTYSVYGWKVAIKRPATEFSELARAGRLGFTLRGAGAGVVTTPRWFRKGTRVRVTLSSGTGVVRRLVTVGADRRLHVAVPLGPGNPYQQYTQQAEADAAQKANSTPGSSTDTVGGSAIYTTNVAFAPLPARHQAGGGDTP